MVEDDTQIWTQLESHIDAQDMKIDGLISQLSSMTEVLTKSFEQLLKSFNITGEEDRMIPMEIEDEEDNRTSLIFKGSNSDPFTSKGDEEEDANSKSTTIIDFELNPNSKTIINFEVKSSNPATTVELEKEEQSRLKINLGKTEKSEFPTQLINLKRSKVIVGVRKHDILFQFMFEQTNIPSKTSSNSIRFRNWCSLNVFTILKPPKPPDYNVMAIVDTYHCNSDPTKLTDDGNYSDTHTIDIISQLENHALNYLEKMKFQLELQEQIGEEVNSKPSTELGNIKQIAIVSDNYSQFNTISNHSLNPKPPDYTNLDKPISFSKPLDYTNFKQLHLIDLDISKDARKVFEESPEPIFRNQVVITRYVCKGVVTSEFELASIYLYEKPLIKYTSITNNYDDDGIHNFKFSHIQSEQADASIVFSYVKHSKPLDYRVIISFEPCYHNSNSNGYKSLKHQICQPVSESYKSSTLNCPCYVINGDKKKVVRSILQMVFKMVVKIYCKEKMLSDAEEMIQDLSANNLLEEEDDGRFTQTLSMAICGGSEPDSDPLAFLLLLTLFNMLLKRGCKPHIYTCTFMDLYGKKNQMERVKQVFEAVSEAQKHIYTCMIDVLAKSAKVDEVCLFYKEENKKGLDVAAVAIRMLVNVLVPFSDTESKSVSG